MNNKLFTVAKFTFLNRFRARSFLVSSIIFALIISVGINLPSIISAFSSGKPMVLGVFADKADIAAKLDAYFSKQEKPDFRIVELPDAVFKDANEKAGRDQIAAKAIQGYLQLEDNASAGFPKTTYKSEKSLSSGKKNALQQALQSVKTEIAVKDAGLSQEQLNRLFAPVQLDTIQLANAKAGSDSGKTESQMTFAVILVYALLILFFISVNTFGNLIAAEVTAEKSSRVMELLISSVSPLKQMFGKVLGMLALGILQIGMFVVIAAINLALPNNRGFLDKYNLSLHDIPVHLIMYFIVFYLLGFFLFGMLYAAVGSLVSRTEDLGQAIMPVTFIGLGSFYIGIYGMTNPTAGFIIVSSFIPLFTPIVMFLRIGLAEPAAWEIILSIAILFATTLLVGWLAAKIYRTGVLLYGKRPSWKEVRKAMQAFKV